MWQVEGIESITKSVSSSKGKFGGIYKKNGDTLLGKDRMLTPMLKEFLEGTRAASRPRKVHQPLVVLHKVCHGD